MTIAELFPIEEGRVMVYRYEGVDAAGDGPHTATMTFSEVREENGALRATLMETVPRRKPSEQGWHLRRSVDTLKEVGAFPEVWLEAPIAVGTKWVTEIYEMQIKAVDVEVTVPAGTFKCVQVVGWIEDMGADAWWYAPGVGLVKEKLEAQPPGRRVYELMSVKPGPVAG